MASQNFLLYDADGREPPTQLDRIDPRTTGQSLGGSAHWSVSWRTLRGGLSDGVDVVELCSGPMTVSILPTRGMGIWKAVADGVTAAWNSPVKRPVHPRHVELGSRNGLGWLDGFNELLCRCGLAFNGPPGIDEDARSPIESQLTLHGKIANLPAHRVEIEVDDQGPGKITVTGVVDECTLFGPQLRLTSRVSVTAGGASLDIEDTVENLASTDGELELLYHINVGSPFLDAGARLHAPASIVAPRDPRAAEGIDSYAAYLGPTPGYAEQAYYFQLREDANGWTETLLSNSSGDRGFGVRLQAEHLPCFTVWKCTQPEADGYVTGLEPGTNFPNFKSFERKQGRVVSVPPGGAYVTRLGIDLHTTTAAIEEVVQRVAALQGADVPRLYPEPTTPFSPVG